VRKLANPRRVERLLTRAIEDFELDLRDVTVLTEAASGPFVVTALLAAQAGSQHVIACTRDSGYGSAREVETYMKEWARFLGVDSRIEVRENAPFHAASEAQLVTNVGFVRPIDENFISRLPTCAAISLMWETWEHRPSDLDLLACRKRNIPVLGTNEADSRLQTFGYLGVVVARLLLEAEIEIVRSSILVVGSNPFGSAISEHLVRTGAIVNQLNPMIDGWASGSAVAELVANSDAVVLAEQRSDTNLVGPPSGIPTASLRKAGGPIIHLSGVLDEHLLDTIGIAKWPRVEVGAFTMTVTSGYSGPRPVIELHAAGLKVGEALVAGMKRFGDAKRAEAFALEHSPAMGWEEPWSH
jgi:hypothetical protein